MADQREPERRPRSPLTPRPPLGRPNRPLKAMIFWVVLVLVLLVAFQMFEMGKTPQYRISYSEFLGQVDRGNIKKITFKGLEVRGDLTVPTTVPLTSATDRSRTRDVKVEQFTLVLPAEDKDLPQRIIDRNPSAVIEGQIPGGSTWVKVVSSGLPLLLIIGLWLLIMRQMQAGGNRAFSFGKSRARMFGGDRPRVTFHDVAGCDEAKQELEEIIEFLKDAKKFQKLGGRIPKGALLLGPPCTGKTLLAKAIAGEAKVPFFSISGSDFVEVFVGVGAARVRDMFEQAKKSAPCIIFVDEIDAVGRHRGAGLGGGNDEREQTLNQMLVEMDGFETNLGVIVMAATNRPDILDPALLRPGRFDRQVYVTLPDVRGREQILNVHMRKVPLGQDVRADILARGTPGFSGADLANLVNESALFAARRNVRVVEMVDFEKAKDKIMMGPERKSMVMPEEERKNTAYHEAGHALVAKLMPKTDPVHKVTVIPRGRALGVTMQLPEGDRYSLDKERMLSTISVLFGGRIAEEVFMHQMTTGASNDFERATAIARDMVTRYGMTDELGPMVYAENEGEVFLGRSVTKTTTMSEETMRKVDLVIRRIIDEQYNIARKLIEDNQDKMHAMAGALLEWETIDSDQIDDIMAGKPPRTPKDWTAPTTPKGGGAPPAVGAGEAAATA